MQPFDVYTTRRASRDLYSRKEKKFRNVFEMYAYLGIPAGTDVKEVMLRNGYGRNSPSFIAECSLDVKQGREEWGDVPGKDYYVLDIKKIRDVRLSSDAHDSSERKQFS